jgi:hypothetical protein
MRSIVPAAALCCAFLALAALVGAASPALAAKKKPVCKEVRVPVRYCVARHRGRMDCTGTVFRYDKVCN